jgi:predicted NBD/HSP70 family sugar kinase
MSDVLCQWCGIAPATDDDGLACETCTQRLAAEASPQPVNEGETLRRQLQVATRALRGIAQLAHNDDLFFVAEQGPIRARKALEDVAAALGDVP